ncbi:hypothetical protein JVT61DRAFT_7087 [Boletus reticuloceps]|uniref:Uncharacterized protein n=1 Tax=Boletus reticuloceps TaxID=495285 RepID=A0A8I2YJ75_9AGAM|nr:hypothetical protein JVT61DRAFT_7087 [Boletus reticuloceps]
MYRKIGRDIKIAINLYERGRLSLANILNCLEISERTFWCIRKLWTETGDVVCHNHGIPGRNSGRVGGRLGARSKPHSESAA